MHASMHACLRRHSITSSKMKIAGVHVLLWFVSVVTGWEEGMLPYTRTWDFYTSIETCNITAAKICQLEVSLPPTI